MTQLESYSAFMGSSNNQGPGQKSAPMGAPSAAKLYTLPRRGKRPLVFNGSELCMAMNFVPGCHSWYEVNIYRTTEQKFVLCIRQFYRDENEKDTVKAWDCETFNEVMDMLESYDPAGDIRVTVAADDPGLSVPEMVAHALSLRAKAESARLQFASLIGELLHELDQDA